MDSYFSGLAQTRALGADTLPDNAKTNYLNTEANMVKPVNQEIDRLKDDWDRHFEQMVEIYNHEFKKDEKRPQEIINFLETGAKAYPKVKQFTDFLQDWNGFNNKLSGIDAQILDAENTPSRLRCGYTRSFAAI